MHSLCTCMCVCLHLCAAYEKVFDVCEVFFFLRRIVNGVLMDWLH